MKLFLIILLIFSLGCQSDDTQTISIEHLKNFAFNYNPCLEGNNCDPFFQLPDAPVNVTNILKSRNDDNDLILYNTLIMLKLYRAQLEMAHQSYDLRGDQFEGKNNPILLAFGKYSGISISGEFVSSDISYHWAKKQASINTNPYINNEIERIEKVLSDIEDGVYWK
jgi:hypothetical protein